MRHENSEPALEDPAMSSIPKSLLKAARRGELHPILEEALAATAVATLELTPVQDPEDDQTQGYVPGQASCNDYDETLWEFVSARDSGFSVDALQEKLAADAQADAEDGIAYAIDEELARDASDLPFFSPAGVSPYLIESGLALTTGVALYDTVILSEDEDLAGRLCFSVHLADGERDLEADDPVFEASFVYLQVVLHDLRVLQAHRGQGASYAAMEYVAYSVYEQMEALAQQLRKAARALGNAFPLHINVIAPARSQMDLVVGEKLADHVLAHIETMLDSELPFSEEHDEMMGEVLDLVEVSFSVPAAASAD